MAKKQVKKKTDDKIVYAFLATFLSIIGFVVALVTKKDDEYVMYYAKQSLVVFLFAVIAWVVNQVVLFIPIIGVAIRVVLNVAV